VATPRVSILLSVYRGERFLREYLENVLQQSVLDQVELSIVHNDPTESERNILDEYSLKVRMVRCEVARENLYKSWNRAILQSSGEYVACWNVDDLRTVDSLEKMIFTLDRHTTVGWTYGDFVITNRFGSTSGAYVQAVEWTRALGSSGAIGGPFFMWRRNIVSKVGWFDEQLLSGGDFDYTVRLSMCTIGKRTATLLGYFLSEEKGLSTSGKLQPIERTVIQLRYAIYQNFDWYYMLEALQYRISHVLQPGGVWTTIATCVPTYGDLMHARKGTAWRIPFYTIYAAARRCIRRFIESMFRI
jgi:glycosyltransferase involved in cell wall biosynthesis